MGFNELLIALWKWVTPRTNHSAEFDIFRRDFGDPEGVVRAIRKAQEGASIEPVSTTQSIHRDADWLKGRPPWISWLMGRTGLSSRTDENEPVVSFYARIGGIHLIGNISGKCCTTLQKTHADGIYLDGGAWPTDCRSELQPVGGSGPNPYGIGETFPGVLLLREIRQAFAEVRREIVITAEKLGRPVLPYLDGVYNGTGSFGERHPAVAAGLAAAPM